MKKRINYIPKIKFNKKMNIHYKVTIIIPMYNSEKYISECINSLLSQTMPLYDIEILCVDDGSTDNTLYICKKYQKEFNNIFLLRTNHKGVSQARNIGIKNAKGKYLTFVDSDDMLSKDTIKNVFEFFEKNFNKTDIITYDTQILKDNKLTPFFRNKLIKENTIIDIKKYPYICQTRINIFVKNEKNPILFDINTSQGEDQKYNLDISLKKGTLGYVKNATYIYRQHGNSSVATKGHPYYSFKQIINLYQSLLHNYKDSEYLSYVKCMILYDLNWRIRSDWLYPYHYSLEEYEKSLLKIKEIINSIESKYINNHPWIIDPYKEYLLSLKTKNKPFAILDYDKWYLCDLGGEIKNSNNIFCVFHRIGIKKNKIYFMGYFKSPILNFTQKPKLYIVINDKTIKEHQLYLSSWSNFETKIKTNTYWGFSIELETGSIEKTFLYLEINTKKYPLTYWFRDRNQISTSKNNYIHITKEYTLIYHKNAFFIRNTKYSDIENANNNLKKILGKYHKGYMALFFIAKNKYGHKNIWLYNDNYLSKDNGYYQFKHDIKKNDNIERYYIYNENEEFLNIFFTEEEKKFVVKFNSTKHKMLFMCCKKILTSFSQECFYIPFKPNIFIKIYYLVNFEVIYLQHGIMHAKIPFLYSKEQSSIDKIIVSTFFEMDILKKELNYKNKDIIPCGMPRLDYIKKNKKSLNKILFIPSWRYYLVDKQPNETWKPKKKFKESLYFINIENFLKNEKLLSFLKKYRYTLDFKLHPIMSLYTNNFVSISPNINIISEVDINDYKLCITDFSSYLYDCVYLNKPLLFYIPDKDELKAGLHSYREFYFPFQEKLGDTASDIHTLVNKIIELHSNDFKITSKYINLYNILFLSKEENHSERIYNQLTNDTMECYV